MYKIHKEKDIDVRYFEEPEVYLINQSLPCFKAILDYMDAYNLKLQDDDKSNILWLSEFAGRHCYMSFGEKQKTVGTEKYVEESLIAKKHYSVLEHNIFTFLFRGVSRGFTHEIVRHRHLSVSQQSTRYVGEEDFCFVKHQVDEHEDFLSNCVRSIETYRTKFIEGKERFSKKYPKDKLRALKSARGYARQYLPHNLEAPIILSGSYATWREILKKRLSKFAEEEMFLVMNKMVKMLPMDKYFWKELEDAQ